MPRFYFHLVQGERRVRDYKGMEFENLEGAKHGVESIVRNTLVAKMLEDENPDGREYEIANEDGRVLDTVRFSDYLPPELKT